jgi:hypothetical protein
MDRLVEPGVQALLANVVSPDTLWVRTADDLNRALYHAWTRRDASKTVVGWAGLE